MAQNMQQVNHMLFDIYALVAIKPHDSVTFLKILIQKHEEVETFSFSPATWEILKRHTGGNIVVELNS